MPIEIREVIIRAPVRQEIAAAEAEPELLNLLAGLAPPEGPVPEPDREAAVPAPILALPAADGLDLW